MKALFQSAAGSAPAEQTDRKEKGVRRLKNEYHLDDQCDCSSGLCLLRYAYQLFFLAVPFTRKQEAHKPEVLHRFAILICARNESAVIADLLQSIQHQSYDQSLITTFVMADNCTDNTAEIARQNGAVVYTRFNKEKVGKGYALEQR